MVLLKSLAAVPAFSLLALASSVQDLTPKNFDQAIFKGTPGLVEFFAPWSAFSFSSDRSIERSNL